MFQGNATAEAQEMLDAAGRELAAKGESTLTVGAHPAPVSPQAEPVELGRLLDQLIVFTRQYVDMNDHQAVAQALWVCHTWAFGAAECTPYLSITSAEKQSGKTRNLEVLNLLVHRPWLTGRATAAVLVRKVAKQTPTLLLDESDAAFKGDKEYVETLRGILNSGYRKGGVVSLCVKAGGDFDLRDFPVFSPKAIAGIGELPDTVRDRSIRIVLQRKPPGTQVTRFRLRDVAVQAEPMRESMEVWATQAIPILIEARPVFPADLDDRAEDVWEPLLAIADMAGDNWPQRAREAALALSTGENREDESLGTRLLADIRQVFDEQGMSRLSSAALVKALTAPDDMPWGDLYGKPLDARRLARLLKPYGVKAVQIRFGDKTGKGWERGCFEDVWRRYLPPMETSETQKHEPVAYVPQPRSVSETTAPRETTPTEECFPVSHVSGNQGGAIAPIVSRQGWSAEL